MLYDKKQHHCMLDLETMGTSPDAPILSVGMAFFTSEGIYSTKQFDIPLWVSVGLGAVICPDTVMWWLQQSSGAQARLSKNTRQSWMLKPDTGYFCAVRDELIKVAEAANGVLLLWGNGSNFDNVILRESLKRAKVDMPIPYYNDRCFRTTKANYPKLDIPFKGTPHVAVCDAEHQAKYLIQLWKTHGACAL